MQSSFKAWWGNQGYNPSDLQAQYYIQAAFYAGWRARKEAEFERLYRIDVV